MSNRAFPTFCHISEFTDMGYKRLDTMICLSDPLTLWAPSFHLVEKHRNSQINADLLCKLVDKGVVRIAAREDWIDNGKKRQRQVPEFEGATWTKHDEIIKEFANKDKNLPAMEARVQKVHEGDGYEVAEKFLAQHPESIETISSLLQRGKIPEGSRERIDKHLLTGFDAAREVLRDARNHGRAIKDVGAKVPFLSLEYGEFIKLINRIDTPIAVTRGERRGRSMRAVADATLGLLDNLACAGHPNLGRFAGSTAHEDLAKWVAGITEDAKDKNVSDIELLMLRALHNDIDRHFPTFDIRPTLDNREFVEILSATLELIAFAISPNDSLHIAGALLVGFQIGHRLLMSFDFLPADYAGMTWPFLYAFGRDPRLGDLDSFRNYLADRLKRLGRRS